jgi:cytochrome c biogenesis protein CcmG/thiol:disulfide interchange protein DsbE
LNKGDHDEIAQQWIVQQGNPYRQIILDADGKIAMMLGVLGTPETFLIDAKGLIRYRHTGILTKEIWQIEFIPLIKKLQEKK